MVTKLIKILLFVILIYLNILPIKAQGLINFGSKTPFVGTNSVFPRSSADRVADSLNIKEFGAVCDGNSHPLSSLYSTLAAAQALYPAAVSLTEEADHAAIVQALASLGTAGGSALIDASSRCMIDRPLLLPASTELRGTMRYRGAPGAANQPQPWASLGSSITEAVTIGTASFSGSVMTAGATSQGAYYVGQPINAASVPQGTAIVSFGTGTGGAGTYNLSNAVTGSIASETVHASASIIQQSGSGVRGLLVQRKGITYLESDASAFAGTAISNVGEPRDMYVADSAIMGFDIGIVSPSGDRFRIENNYIDAQECIDVFYSFDTSRLLHNHCWPFVTLQNATLNPTANAWADRNGMGMYLAGGSDGTVIDDFLSYQHRGGGLVYGGSAGNSTASHIFIDGTPRAPVAGETENGIWFQPGTGNVTVTDADVYSQNVGILNDTTNGQVYLNNARVHYSYLHNYQNNSGSIVGTNWYSQTPNTGHAIAITGASAVLKLAGYTASGTPSAQYDVYNAVSNTSTMITGYSTDRTPTQVGMYVTGSFYPTIASADPLPIPQSGDTFLISGTTGFGTATTFYPGRRITLIIQNGLVMYSGSTFALAGGSAANLPANSTISFVSTASGYIETGRTGAGVFVSAPTSSTSACSPGDFSASASYTYICQTINTWVRSAVVGGW